MDYFGSLADEIQEIIFNLACVGEKEEYRKALFVNKQWYRTIMFIHLHKLRSQFMWHYSRNVFRLSIYRNNLRALHHLYCLNIFESLDIHIIDYDTEFKDQICKLLKQNNLKLLYIQAKLQLDLFDHILQNNNIEVLVMNQLVESITWIPKNLTSLTVYKTKISNWMPLTRLEHLRTFEFYDLIQLSEEMLSFLASLTTLEELTFGSIISMTGSLPTICKFTYPNLTSLVLGAEAMKDAPLHLRKLTNLRRLHLECATEHLSALDSLTCLTNLSVGTCDLANFKALEALSNLKKLQLREAPEHLAGIELLHNMEFLQIGRSSTLEDEDFGRLMSLSNLTTLNLGYPKKITPAVLNHLTRLSSLQSLSYWGHSALDKMNESHSHTFFVNYNAFTVKKAEASDFWQFN